MRLALLVGLSTVVNQAAGLSPAAPGNNLVGVAATGSAGTITTTSGASGSGSPLGILLGVTKP